MAEARTVLVNSLCGITCLILLGMGGEGSGTSSSAWLPEELDAANTARQCEYLTSEERATVLYLNLARVFPRKFAVMHLEPYRRSFDGRLLKRAGKPDIITSEGANAVKECIKEMNSRKTVGALLPSHGMSLAARDHAADQGPRGETGHEGRDGSTPRQRMERFGEWEKSCGECISYGPEEAVEIVVQLLVDDAVPGRGHRRNLLNGLFERVGVAIGPHEDFRFVCVIDLAAAYTDKDSADAHDSH